MKWGELNPKLKCATVGKNIRTGGMWVPLAEGEQPARALSVAQGWEVAVSAHPSSFLLISKGAKVTKECAHQVHTWDASYSTGIAKATKSY